jgi:o-succinylbenzoate synthase
LLKSQFSKFTLKFKFEAGTSRGVLTEKDSYFIKIWDKDKSVFGLGEAGPLFGLSVEFDANFEELFKHFISLLNTESYDLAQDYAIPSSVKFALEMAILDLNNGGKRLIYDNAFARSETSIPINGLVWMGDKDFMMAQLKEKIDSGYNCIKLKIGAINFTDELDLIKYIRKEYAVEDMIIRVDANGAFGYDVALRNMESLSQLDVHSIEQPIKANQIELMSRLIKESPMPIALDEELIGIRKPSEKLDLLKVLNPHYLVLKPSLHGGLSETQEWIKLAEQNSIKWWITSALESNIGLNAVTQLCANYSNEAHQGLGTGQLYHNNIDSPLEIENGFVKRNPSKNWDLIGLF